MIDESMYELVDLYLKGALPPNHPFSISVKTDPEIRKMVETQGLIRDAVVDLRLIQFQSVVQQHHQKEKAKFFNNSFKKYFPWLAGAILLLSSIYFYQQYNVLINRNNGISNTTAKPGISEGPGQEEQAPKDTISKNQHEPPKDRTSKYRSHHGVHKVHEGKSGVEKRDTIVHSKPTQPATQIPVIPNPVPSYSPSVDPCKNITINAEIASSKPCLGKSDGSILFQEVDGGTEPYFYSIDKGKSFQESASFHNLSHGVYQLIVKDKNFCQSTVDPSFELENKNCQKTRNLTFNPNYSSTIEIPKELNESATFSIYDKSGQEMISRTINAQEMILWDGVGEGHLLVPGLYVYIIRYNSQKEEQGTITVMY